MKSVWNVKVWGVRGAFPAPGREFLEYGGNTACVSAEHGEELVVFDAGSGLVQLGHELSKIGKKKVHILLSHLHIDHLIGLFQFSLLYDPEAEIHLYGETREGGLLKQLENLLGPPYWPVGLCNALARVEVHELIPGESIFLGGNEAEGDRIEVRTLRGHHPNQSLLYRVKAEEKSIIYTLDCEMNDEMYRSLEGFSQGGDLLIWDANFTDADLEKHRGWGHSSWEQGIAFCRGAGVKEILMTHYSSDYTDDFLRREEMKAKQTASFCRFAKEGMMTRI